MNKFLFYSTKKKDTYRNRRFGKPEKTQERKMRHHIVACDTTPARCDVVDFSIAASARAWLISRTTNFVLKESD